MEQTGATIEFRWMTLLGFSVMLFLLINFMYAVVGMLTPIAFRLYGTELTQKFGLIVSPRADKAVFGDAIESVIKQPSAMVTKVSVYDMISGLYIAIAILHFCLVWFGLRNGLAWSLWALTFSDIAVVAGYLLATYHFSNNLTPLRFGDLAPYATLPALILPFATLLGWLGLR